MKIFNLLIIFKLLVQDNIVSCNDELLAKFHQNKFKIRDERMQLFRYNKSFYNFFEIKAFKHNRTTTAHNVSVNFKFDVQDKIEILVQCYKFLSNEYRHFPIRFQVNLKKFMDTNAIGLGDGVRGCGNIDKFYFYKNVTYYICNFVLDATRFPPLIPNGKYKFDITYLYSDQDVALVYIFLEIYIPFVYPKNKN